MQLFPGYNADGTESILLAHHKIANLVFFALVCATVQTRSELVCSFLLCLCFSLRCFGGRFSVSKLFFFYTAGRQMEGKVSARGSNLRSLNLAPKAFLPSDHKS